MEVVKMLFQLNRFIPIAEKIIPRRSSIPILTNICFNDGKIVATDLDTALVMTVDDKSRFIIPVKILKTILKSKPKTLKFEILADNKVKISYDSKSITFNSESVEEFPAVPKGRFKTVAVWSKDVIKTLHDQLPYCSTDETRMPLTGVYINQNHHIETCATSGHVLKLIKEIDVDKKSKLSADFTAIIPKRALQILSRFTLKEVKVAVREDQFKFTLDKGLELFVRKIEGEYPKYQNVIPKEHSGSVHFDKGEMQAIIKDAINFTNRHDHLAEFLIAKDEILISAENLEAEMKWQGSLAVIDITGKENMNIGINLELLEKILKGISSKEVIWIYESPNSPLLFSDNGESGNEVINLLMPIRLEDN
jgi:DNA polymerase III subunit beta